MIEARGLGFSHRGTGTRQLDDITCDIPAGSRVDLLVRAQAEGLVPTLDLQHAF